ncbi:hypothetical protein OH491_07470 [Termitidicoccus mucosus]|uniref:hypothetical protein n=1 Tax=Termitidicoccus mucosus TaxID=1184151 RepID=UPI002FEE3F3E
MWIAAAAVFLLGLAVGGAGAVWFGTRALRTRLQAGPEAWPAQSERIIDRIQADLTKSLALTPEESARVEATLRESAGAMRAIRLRAFAQARMELRAAIRKIAAELPPEKRDEFHRVMARRYERLGLQPPSPTLPADAETTP